MEANQPMTTYTQEESASLIKAAVVTGMAVAIADLGIVSTAMEMSALTQEILNATKKFPSNNLIQAAFSEENIKKIASGTAPKDMTPENAVELAVEAINQGLAIASSAPSTEVTQYKELIYACGERVASAAGSGLFGSGNPKVSDQEAAVLTKIKAALGI
jgi:uncharacterized NAD-dependent epimerase/dehydratase family protein